MPEGRNYGARESALYLEIEKLFITDGLSRRAIERQMGGRASYATIVTYCNRALKVAKSNGVEITPRKRDGSFVPKRAFSEIHHTVGLKLLQHRMVTLRGVGPLGFSAAVGVGNQMTVQAMEHGKYEFTLSELVRIAEVLAVSLPELLTPFRQTHANKEEAA